MLGPQILTVNPMRKRHRRRRNPSFKARRHRVARAHNRVHHRRRHRVHNRFRHHARRRHSRMPNPLSTSGITALAVPAGIGAASAVALDVALAYLPLPAAVQTGWGNMLAKIGLAIGAGFAIGHFTSRRTGALVAGGALTVYGYEALKMALAPTLGTSVKGLSGLADFADYSSVGVGAYLPARQGVGAYMNPAPMLPAPAPRGAPAATLRAKQVAGLSAYTARSRAG